VFETSLDAWYAWLGVALASVAVYGVAMGLPAAAPPTPAPAADTIDSVASSQHGARERVDIEAEELRLDPHRISLRTDGGTAHARFAYGPVTPVADGPLAPLLAGQPPEEVFTNPSEFERALERAQERNSTWQPAPDELVVQRISWGGTDATVVG